ncbi:MAG: hypothetical protein KGL39_27475 [Patescibacteria group bacterium]|nr:hypothetical protein [Patescibacteria group bacterium]
MSATSIATARNAKTEQYLAQLVRTSAFGICTRKQRIEQAIAMGCKFESVQVPDEAKMRKLEREIETMRRMDNGFYVPIGNENHPITRKFNALKAELAAKPTMTEYRLWVHGANSEYFNELTKTEWEYAQALLEPYDPMPEAYTD